MSQISLNLCRTNGTHLEKVHDNGFCEQCGMDDPKITKTTLKFIWWIRDSSQQGASLPIGEVLRRIDESDPDTRIDIKENLEILIDYYGEDETIKYILD